MNVTLVKASVIALGPTGMLVLGTAWFSKRRSMSALLLVAGATCLVIVIFAHVCEALHWFPGLHWGEQHSVGHYLDLSSAILGLSLLLAAALLYATERRRGLVLKNGQ